MVYLLLSYSAAADTIKCERLGLEFDASVNGTSRLVLSEVLDRQASKFGFSITSSASADVVLNFSNANQSVVGDEGFAIRLDGDTQKVIMIEASRLRGHLFAIGHLMKQISMHDYSPQMQVVQGIQQPAYDLRGHQLGYRNTANSWDAWTPDQFEEYILDLVMLGSNAIEDIPFQSNEQSVHMVMPHRSMHPLISTMCAKYDIEYWVWTPGPGDLSKKENIEKGLTQFDKLMGDLDHLSAIFYPGGDPGDNHPQYIFPYLDSVAQMSQDRFPSTKIWISLQGFDSSETVYFFDKLESDAPDWFGGLVHGPSSPPLWLERKMLPKQYPIRLYGDITHTIRCQYPVPEWDQAFALTLGREPVNPEPARYRKVFAENMPFTGGFLSYSDGVHDDVNKVVWNQLGWDPKATVVNILAHYCSYFFPSTETQKVVDGILALEKNWHGPIDENGGIEATLAWWQNLNTKHPELQDNWRWQQLIFRAYHDVFVRRKAMHDRALEKEVLDYLSQGKDHVLEAINHAEEILSNNDLDPATTLLRDTIIQIGAKLFQLVGLQTSVPKYQASNYERGSVLDFLDIPLNNQWWYEDQFDSIRALANVNDQKLHLQQIVKWNNPGPKAYYDNISSVSQSPHVTSSTDDAIDYAWWDNGRSRARLSSQLFQFSPTLTYRIPADSHYILRVAGYGEALVRINGEKLIPRHYDKALGGFKEFEVPVHLTAEGLINVSFDRPDEGHLNWREYSRVSDVWLLPFDNNQTENQKK